MAPATTVDHVQPVSKGGELYNPSNLVAACVSCNSRKQAKPTSVFLKRYSTAMLSREILSPNESTSYD